MYSNKENVNILTSLLIAHGVANAVVCPGSRNAPIVHNMNACGKIACRVVTDERSAGFFALGMAQRLSQPVALCVTSGSALLNLLPAVAEACYQHIPLVVISADRPPQWIDQLDGQTIPQPDALGRFVKKAVSLPECHNADAEQRWYCNRLVNEALLATHHHGTGPVHINVPLSEPLYEFTTAQLPTERTIERHSPSLSPAQIETIADRFFAAKRPLLVSGQPLNSCWEEAVSRIADDADYHPDFILYTEGTIVSKRVKQFLRQAEDAEVWQVSRDGEVHDTLMHATHVAEGDATPLLQLIRSRQQQQPHPFVSRWQQLLAAIDKELQAEELPFSEASVARQFEQTLETWAATQPEPPFQVHYANSTAIRLANRYAHHHVWCNRGVNGIEGSLSTAAGMSAVSPERVFCVIGDLSFFYDQNALWNAHVRGNLRILMLNNGGGAIFQRFGALRQSEARSMVMATHETNAAGICQQCNVGYRCAGTQDDIAEALSWLIASDSQRPLLLEVSFPIK